MRSDCRGVARGTQPNRSTSARGPPVCINSIAQQAKPNSMYHCEEARPQLRRSSTFVVKAVSGKLFVNGIGPPISATYLILAALDESSSKEATLYEYIQDQSPGTHRCFQRKKANRCSP